MKGFNDFNWLSNYEVKNGIYQKTKFNKYNDFSDSRRVAYEPDITGYGYMFFTKPDLNLRSKHNPFTRDNEFYAYPHQLSKGKRGSALLNSLTYENPYNNPVKSNFIPLLTNHFNSFETKDNVLNTNDLYETLSGYKLKLPSTMSDSISGEFAIEYNEDTFLSITKLHKVWVDYIDYVNRGFIHPRREYVKGRSRRLIDYMSSVYYVKTLPDARTITFFTKYTGVFPTSIPYSSHSFTAGTNDANKVSVNYAYMFKEDLDVEILTDMAKMEPMDGDPKFITKNGKLYLRFNGEVDK